MDVRKRTGYVSSAAPSRKSSAKSVLSSGSGKSVVRKNSGKFDGGNRKKSDQLNSSNSLTRKKNSAHKLSAHTQRDQIIADVYKKYEQLKEFDLTCSYDSDYTSGQIRGEEPDNTSRVETYIKDHSHIFKELHRQGEKKCAESGRSKPFSENGMKAAVERKPTALNSGESTSCRRKKATDTKYEYYSRHTQMTSKRLTMLFDICNLDNTSGMDTKGRSKESPSVPMNSQKRYHTIHGGARLQDLYSTLDSHDRSRISQLSIDSKEKSKYSYLSDSPRGSISSRDSRSSYSAVPMNFIPGQTKPIVRERPMSLTLDRNRKNTVCFKGIMCEIDRRTPRTFRAMAHAGMISLSVMGPSDHKCSQ